MAEDTPGVGHNSRTQLKSLIERVERLIEDRKTVQADIKEVFAEAKANGFDTKAMRKAIAIRAMDRDKYENEKAVLETYLANLGFME